MFWSVLVDDIFSIQRAYIQLASDIKQFVLGMIWGKVHWCLDIHRSIDILLNSMYQKNIWHGKIMEIYKVGPLPVINGVITPISRVITPVTHLFSAIYRAEITPLITIGSGPTLYPWIENQPPTWMTLFRIPKRLPQKTAEWFRNSET